jgi:nucleoside-diphosphate-sugar epimerase
MKLLVTGGSGFIGRHFIDYMAAKGHQICSIDVVPPQETKHAQYFIKCDILDAGAVKAVFAKFQPDWVVHLAAKADLSHTGPVEPYYQTITGGSQNILDAVKATPPVKRLIMTSTQYVCRPGHTPLTMDDYDPHTVYGEAKVIMEKYTKTANLDCVWTITRPTIIWGPWNTFYRDTLYKAMEKGYYFHPTGKSAMLGFGYIRNSVRQMEQLLEADAALVNKKTFYLGDGIFALVDWMNGQCLLLTGHKIRYIPRFLIWSMAKIGDFLEAVTGRKFLMYSFRYKNMTADYIVPLEPALALFGKPEVSMEQAIKETVAWSREHPWK